MAESKSDAKPDGSGMRKSMDDMSKDELKEFILKLRSHAKLIMGEKKIAEDLFSQATKEKEEFRQKAMNLLKRCKELESSPGGGASVTSLSDPESTAQLFEVYFNSLCTPSDTIRLGTDVSADIISVFSFQGAIF